MQKAEENLTEGIQTGEVLAEKPLKEKFLARECLLTGEPPTSKQKTLNKISSFPEAPVQLFTQTF